MIFPGEIGAFPERNDTGAEVVIYHGWPVIYLWRPVSDFSQFDKPTTAFIWNVFSAHDGFRPIALALDIALASMILAAVVGFWEWRRRRAPRFQFSLRTLLLFVILAAIALGYWGFERRADDKFVDALQSVVVNPSDRPILRNRIPRFPLWLRRLVGDDFLNATGITRVRTGLSVVWTAATHEKVKRLISRFPADVDLEVKEAPDDAGIDRFVELAPLESLVLRDAPSRFVRRLSELPSLHNLGIDASYARALDDTGLASLCIMPSLRQLTVNDAHRITDQGVIDFANGSHVEVLVFWHAKLSHKALSGIASLRELRILALNSSKVHDDDLSALTDNETVERLSFWEAPITDKSVDTLISMPKLRVLTLLGTAISDAAVNRFRQERPDLKVVADRETDAIDAVKMSMKDVTDGKTTRLTIQGRSIRDGHLSQIGALTKVDSLALNALLLTDMTAARVETLELLKELDISGSQITANGLRHLTKLPRLRTLTLDEDQVTDETINVLKQMPVLKNVWVKLGLEPADSKKLGTKMRAMLPAYDLHFEEPRSGTDPWE